MKRRLVVTLLVISLFVISTSFAALPAASTGAVESYLVLGGNNKLPSGLAAKLSAAGGTLVHTIPQIGIGVAESSDPNFEAKAEKIKGVELVVRNPLMKLTDPQPTEAVDTEVGVPPFSGDNDFYYDLQWGHDAIDSFEAWNAGIRGAGARIAILDTGFDLDHPDLAPNINLGLSRNFVPGETLSYALNDPFSHGTHTAGIAAAADNGFGVIGVAPEAELVLVKVLGDEGSGDFDWLLSAIAYAAGEADADVISMSLGALVPRHSDDPLEAREIAELRIALARASAYAYSQKATVVASAGNEAVNLDEGVYLHLPSDTPGFISVSATTPIGWAVDPLNAFLDYPTSYTNYGQTAIDFAAPGGDVLYPGEELCTVGVLVPLTRPCWVFDLVFSTGANLNPNIASFFWAGGTSMSAPHVAGNAALIVGMHGGELDPALVKAILKRTADDLGPPGKDAYYGFGRINAGNLAP